MFAAELEGIQVVSLTVGIIVAIAAGTAAVFVIFEKITGSLGRWFERHFRDSLEPTNEAIADLRSETRSADLYNRHHLGPNGTTMPMHLRLKDVERTVTQTTSLPDVIEPVRHRAMDVLPLVVVGRQAVGLFHPDVVLDAFSLDGRRRGDDHEHGPFRREQPVGVVVDLLATEVPDVDVGRGSGLSMRACRG
jgi:hypothetical protein